MRTELDIATGALLLALSCGCSDPPGGDPPADAGETGVVEHTDVRYTEDRETCSDRNPLRNAYFGDLHVHTSYSFDAYFVENRNTPSEAYRFAQGERVELPPIGPDGEGRRSVKLRRPLDFAAVTDHSEYLGEVDLCTDPSSSVYDASICESLRREGDATGFYLFSSILGRDEPERPGAICGADGVSCLRRAQSAWERIQRAAERAYDRSSSCSFTTFVGYEHTNTPDGNNVHRNVLFRNADVPGRPISTFEEPHAAGLWRRLREVCLRDDSDCDVLTIPHNSNLSSGAMFARRYRGADTRAEKRRLAELRSRIEPLMEIYQHKGSMECVNGIDGALGTPDEFCNFEKVYRDDPEDCGSETGEFGLVGLGCVSRRNFYRNILALGLREKQKLGVDPYRLGVVASTDTHNSTPGAVSERNWKGHFGLDQASPRRRLGADDDRSTFAAAKSPGGLAGVWAVENSRDAIFEALKRRETFGTTGPRITVRLFGGWDLPDEMCGDPNFVETGYRRGVPMGGELEADGERGPTFAVLAHRDPGTDDVPGVPLQQIQIVEGTVRPDGEASVEVHTVAGDPDSAASVDVETCERSGNGYDTLCATWTDPEFDARDRSFYYARVLQNPTCRWSRRQCNALPESKRPETCSDPAIPDTIQERAWTSPIWVEPGG